MGETAPGKGTASLVGVGLGIAVVLALLSPLAASDPDGLGRVAIDLGFDSRVVAPAFEIFPAYNVPFISDGNVSGIVAMVIGTLLVFGFVFVVARIQHKKSSA